MAIEIKHKLIYRMLPAKLDAEITVTEKHPKNSLCPRRYLLKKPRVLKGAWSGTMVKRQVHPELPWRN
jgi:hypothetical protein